MNTKRKDDLIEAALELKATFVGGLLLEAIHNGTRPEIVGATAADFVDYCKLLGASPDSVLNESSREAWTLPEDMKDWVVAGALEAIDGVSDEADEHRPAVVMRGEALFTKKQAQSIRLREMAGSPKHIRTLEVEFPHSDKETQWFEFDANLFDAETVEFIDRKTIFVTPKEGA